MPPLLAESVLAGRVCSPVDRALTVQSFVTLAIAVLPPQEPALAIEPAPISGSRVCFVASIGAAPFGLAPPPGVETDLHAP